MNSDGTENKQISADANQNLDPTVSPDGRYIAWSSSPGDSRNIWRMELDGSNPKQLTHGTGEWFTQFSPDGKWLVYQELGSGGIDRMLVKTLLDGGTAVRLTDKSSYAPALSPDGKLIAFNYRREPGAPVHIAVMSIEGGPLIKLFEIPGFNDRAIRWMPDREAVAYIVTKGGVSNIWSQPLAGGPPKQLTEFSSHQIFDFAWSRDGRQLALSRGVINSDVAMISYLR